MIFSAAGTNDTTLLRDALTAELNRQRATSQPIVERAKLLDQGVRRLSAQTLQVKEELAEANRLRSRALAGSNRVEERRVLSVCGSVAASFESSFFQCHQRSNFPPMINLAACPKFQPRRRTRRRRTPRRHVCRPRHHAISFTRHYRRVRGLPCGQHHQPAKPIILSNANFYRWT